MDKKIKLIVVTSVVAVMATGCSGYRGSNQSVNNNGSDGSFDNSSSANGGSSQVARSGQVYGQRRPATCTPCAAATTTPKQTYTYTPPPKKTYTRPAPQPAGQHNQQYYIDRWNRQQAQQNNKTKTTTYNGYGSGNYNVNADAGNTTYYDYSSAGQANNTAATSSANVSASNKSIYTGSYQQKTYKPYQPTTYAGGGAATTNTSTSNTTYTGGSSAGNGSTYTVRKGDTVFEIMRQTGVYWKDIIRINNLQAPAYNINPGQVIRLK